MRALLTNIQKLLGNSVKVWGSTLLLLVSVDL